MNDYTLRPVAAAPSIKYRKKPVVISAQQYRGPAMIHRSDPDCQFAHHWLPDGVLFLSDPALNEKYNNPDLLFPMIQTLEGNMRVDPGSMVITGVEGEKYACKLEIFHKTYEEVPVFWKTIWKDIRDFLTSVATIAFVCIFGMILGAIAVECFKVIGQILP